MTRDDELGIELEALVRRHGLVRVLDALVELCGNRAERVGAVLRAHDGVGISGLLRGLGQYMLRRGRERL